jgi:hypothetical protein
MPRIASDPLLEFLGIIWLEGIGAWCHECLQWIPWGGRQTMDGYIILSNSAYGINISDAIVVDRLLWVWRGEKRGNQTVNMPVCIQACS